MIERYDTLMINQVLEAASRYPHDSLFSSLSTCDQCCIFGLINQVHWLDNPWNARDPNPNPNPNPHWTDNPWNARDNITKSYAGRAAPCPAKSLVQPPALLPLTMQSCTTTCHTGPSHCLWPCHRCCTYRLSKSISGFMANASPRPLTVTMRYFWCAPACGDAPLPSCAHVPLRIAASLDLLLGFV